ncbi:TAXI family TRAP transporter solute-binding subunit [Nitrospirillum sp. BR 11828]|uniref:TAXI family TRAP transporter solute-binding subunit n=1 Tax=Nitrospirillum sp. BR 11828 TaxID=3104325 RepID=UPI003A101A85
MAGHHRAAGRTGLWHRQGAVAPQHPPPAGRRPSPGESIRKEAALTGLAVPLHPGAARYYREQGFDVSLATSG